MIYPEDTQERFVRKVENTAISVMIGLLIALLIAAFAIGCTPTRKASEPIGPYHIKDPNT